MSNEVLKEKICKDIVLEMIDNVVKNRSDVKIKYDEDDDLQETPEMKRKYYEAFEIDEEALRKK